jgi:hypothetical protein
MITWLLFVDVDSEVLAASVPAKNLRTRTEQAVARLKDIRGALSLEGLVEFLRLYGMFWRPMLRDKVC